MERFGNAEIDIIPTNSNLLRDELKPECYGEQTPKLWIVKPGDVNYFSTHLDGDCLRVTPLIQVAQAQQIVSGPAAADLPVVLVGDINASPLSSAPSAYQILVGNGFVDAWQTVGIGDGFTCCQADNLVNQISMLETRIDGVFYLGNIQTREVMVLGDKVEDRTISGLWPSDHAGVVATLRLLADDNENDNE